MPPKKKPVQQGEGLYDWTARNIFRSNLRLGEVHPPMWGKKGFVTPSFLGPGTSLLDKLREGVLPINEQDKIARMHDIRYSLSTNADEVRYADNKMLSKLNETYKNKDTYAINHYTGYIPIRAKMWAEDIGLMKKGSFSGMKGNLLNTEDRALLEKERDAMIQEGYGKGKTKSPWMTHVDNIRKKHPQKSYKDCLKLASASFKK